MIDMFIGCEDITKTPFKTIVVNAANTNYSHGSGVALAI